jgi:hypothetical protein
MLLTVPLSVFMISPMHVIFCYSHALNKRAKLLNFLKSEYISKLVFNLSSSSIKSRIDFPAVGNILHAVIKVKHILVEVKRYRGWLEHRLLEQL